MANVEENLRQALAHHQAGRLAEAEQLYRRVLAADRTNADALHLLGALAMQAGHTEAAVALIGEAIKVQPEIAAFHNNLGEAYRRLGRYGEAITAYQRALALAPEFAEAHNNLGTVHYNQGWLAAALACYERAIVLQPDYPNAHYNRARIWLAQGDFERGWKEYEWRWRKPEFHRLHLAQPEWDGTPLAGRTLLVRAEQGLGDTLQFIRYVRELRGAGHRVITEVQPQLVALLSASGFDNLVPTGAPRPPFDVQAMLLSMPYLFGTTLETIPARVPYLRAEPALRAKWKGRLADLGGRLKIGIHWQGFRNSPLEPWRSIPLAAFEQLASAEGVKLVSLQKGFGSEQIAAATFEVVDWSAEIDEAGGPFMDTAALMAELDLVITSDTATAHLAGALGVDVWVALCASPDCRWLLKRDDSPWYPTMRLFRQQQLGDWSDVFAEIRAALHERPQSGDVPENR